MVCGPSHVNECRALGDGMPDKESMLTGLMVYHIQLPRCPNTLRLIGCPHVLSMWQRVTKSLQKGAVVSLVRNTVDFWGVALFGLGVSDQYVRLCKSGCNYATETDMSVHVILVSDSSCMPRHIHDFCAKKMGISTT